MYSGEIICCTLFYGEIEMKELLFIFMGYGALLVYLAIVIYSIGK